MKAKPIVFKPANQGLMETKTETTVIEMPTGDPLVIQNTTTETEPSEDWIRDQARISEFFSNPIDYTLKLLQPYKPLLVTIGIALLVILTIKLVGTLLGAILGVATTIPVLSPLFELVGIIYSGWFTYRYLLSAGKRQELSQKFSKFKQEFIGGINDSIEEVRSDLQ